MAATPKQIELEDPVYTQNVLSCQLTGQGRQTFAECACLMTNLSTDPPIQQACVAGFNQANLGQGKPPHCEKYRDSYSIGFIRGSQFPPQWGNKKWIY
jgi:hypothetical protein